MSQFTIEAAAKAKANKLSEWMHALSSKDPPNNKFSKI